MGVAIVTSEALLAADAADPAIAATRTDFGDFVRQALGLTISGILVRR